MPRHPPHTIKDPNGREWEVYDFRLVEGKIVSMEFGTGEQRIFVPTDGGARRYQPLYTRERVRGTALEVLLDQLANASIWHADDPNRTAQFANRKPERVDPT